MTDVTGEIVSHETRAYGAVRRGFTQFADRDVLWAKITPCMENGKAAVAKNLVNGIGCGTTEFFVLRSRGALDPEYLHRFMRQESYRKAARKTMQSGVGQARVPKEFVLETEIPLPPLAEQRRIIRKTDELQARIRRAREALEAIPPLLEKFRQSVLAAAFRGDLTADWRERNRDVEPVSVLLDRIRAERRRTWEIAELEKMRGKGKGPKDDHWKQRYREPEAIEASTLPELPEGWAWISLDGLAWSLRSGTAATSLREQTDLPVLRSSAVRPGEIDFADRNYLPNGACGDDDLIAKGDFLITRLSGSLEYVGNCAVVRELECPRIAYPDRLFRVRPVGCVEASFLEFAFAARSLRGAMEEAAKSSAGHQRISMSDLKQFAIPLPSLAEQRVIADRIRNMFNRVERITAHQPLLAGSLAAMDESILSKALRGELVPQDPHDEPASVLLERIRTERGRDQPKRGRRAQPAG